MSLVTRSERVTTMRSPLETVRNRSPSAARTPLPSIVIATVESMEQMLKTGFPSKISNEDDSLNCFGIHYRAAEIYAKLGSLEKAQLDELLDPKNMLAAH